MAVLDSGIGIDSETAERLFSAFFTTKPSGMGMGLSISRSIIRAHGGRLWVSPNADHGAAFQFTVPISGSGCIVKDADAIVFVVDDDSSIREAIKSLIRSGGTTRRDLRNRARIPAEQTAGAARMRGARCASCPD